VTGRPPAWAAALMAAAGLLLLGGSCQGGARAAAPQCHYRAGRALPDLRCTPGMTNPAVRQYTDWHDDPTGARVDTTKETICRAGWAASVRPPPDYTRRLKLEQMRRYGATGPPSAYQEDHLVPLELGGSPTDPGNLWPQPAGYARAKDRAENALRRLVCQGAISLWAARGLIATDWRAGASFAAWAESQHG
jgi:hypothetical protein